MPSENVRTGIDTGSGGSAISHHGDVTKPADGKATALSQESDDQPIEVRPEKQVEIYSDMGRTRTGIWYSPLGSHSSPEIWGDRTFAANDRVHPNAKPQDRGSNPAVSEAQRSFMGAELGRLRRGEATETGMSEEQLRDFAKKKHRRKKKHNPY